VEAAVGIEPTIWALQARALPLGHAAEGEEDYLGSRPQSIPRGGPPSFSAQPLRKTSAAALVALCCELGERVPPAAEHHPIAALRDGVHEVRLGAVAEAGRKALGHQLPLHAAQQRSVPG
jgi:hypothetical protein